jgi:hypothetical protein
MSESSTRDLDQGADEPPPSHALTVHDRLLRLVEVHPPVVRRGRVRGELVGSVRLPFGAVRDGVVTDVRTVAQAMSDLVSGCLPDPDSRPPLRVGFFPVGAAVYVFGVAERREDDWRNRLDEFAAQARSAVGVPVVIAVGEPTRGGGSATVVICPEEPLDALLRAGEHAGLSFEAVELTAAPLIRGTASPSGQAGARVVRHRAAGDGREVVALDIDGHLVAASTMPSPPWWSSVWLRPRLSRIQVRPADLESRLGLAGSALTQESVAGLPLEAGFVTDLAERLASCPPESAGEVVTSDSLPFRGERWAAADLREAEALVLGVGLATHAGAGPGRPSVSLAVDLSAGRDGDGEAEDGPPAPASPPRRSSVRGGVLAGSAVAAVALLVTVGAFTLTEDLQAVESSSAIEASSPTTRGPSTPLTEPSEVTASAGAPITSAAETSAVAPSPGLVTEVPSPLPPSAAPPATTSPSATSPSFTSTCRWRVGDGVSAYIEAEGATTMTNRFGVEREGDVSYVVSRGDGDTRDSRAGFPIEILPGTSEIHVWSRGRGPSPQEHNFILENPLGSPVLSVPVRSSWAWLRGPVLENPPAGAQGLALFNAQDNAELDKIFLTTDPDQRPEDRGSTDLCDTRSGFE